MQDVGTGPRPRAWQPCAEERIRVDADAAAQDIAAAVQRLGRPLVAQCETLLLLCIGTDRSIGDALGPLVGSLLREGGKWPFRVFGTLDEPVHAGNLAAALAKVETESPRALVVAVDACLGRLESVGSITIGQGPLRPGSGVNKSLPAVGHLSITGVVNVGGFMEYFVLQNTRLGPVMRMAKVLAAGLARGLTGLSAALAPTGSDSADPAGRGAD